MHHLEGIVAVPVAVFCIEDLDVRMSFHYSTESVEALVIQSGRDTAQNDDIALAIELFRQIFSRQFAEGRIVAGDIGVLGGGVGQAAVNHGDIHALVLDLRHRLGKRSGFQREDHQGIDFVYGQHVLQLVCLFRRCSRGLDDDLQIRMRFFQLFLGFICPPHDASGETMGGGRDGDAERDFFGRVGGQGRKGRYGHCGHGGCR